jgi:micrococcal nuclease
MTRVCASLLALVPALASPAFAESFHGRIVAISDGGVRLYGIDSPERKQTFGTRARQHTDALAHEKLVRVEVKSMDRNGRTVGVIFLSDGRNLNHELVRAGFAWWVPKYARNDHELERLEQDARKAKRGLWADPNPVPPWEYRTAR